MVRRRQLRELPCDAASRFRISPSSSSSNCEAQLDMKVLDRSVVRGEDSLSVAVVYDLASRFVLFDFRAWRLCLVDVAKDPYCTPFLTGMIGLAEDDSGCVRVEAI